MVLHVMVLLGVADVVFVVVVFKSTLQILLPGLTRPIPRLYVVIR